MLALMISLVLTALVALSPADELADRIAALGKAGQQVEASAVREVAALGTRASLDALLAFFESNTAPYPRVATVRALDAYGGDDALAVPALEFLVLQATGAEDQAVAMAALETIHSFPTLGRGYLRGIVGLPARDEIRARALLLHAREADDEDKEWYRELADPEEDKRLTAVRRSARNAPGGKEPPKFAHRLLELRRVAFLAAADSYSPNALLALHKKEQDHQQLLAIVRELGRREHRKAEGLARDLLESVDPPHHVRFAAAELLLALRGARALDEFAELAVKVATPPLLRKELAGLVAAGAPNKLRSKLVKRIGRGRAGERTFVLLALRGLQDGKAIDRAREELLEADVDIVAAAAAFLGAAGQPADIDPIRELFAGSEERAVVVAAMEALTELYQGSEDWQMQLAAYAKGTDPLRAPLAVAEYVRLSGGSQPEFLLELLEHPSWSTRLAALEALAGLRDEAYLGPIIEQMQLEVGRMRLAFADALFDLTGQLFGNRAPAWKGWYEGEGKGLELPGEATIAEARRLRAERRSRERTEVSRFFGIPLETERIIFVLDISGSMVASLRGLYQGNPGEPRIDRAKAELIAAIRDLKPTAQFNIIAFSSAVNVFSDRSVGAEEAPAKDAAVDWVSGLGAIGGTNLYGAVARALDDQHVDTIVVLSDGQPSTGDIVDPGAIREAIRRRNQGRRVVIHTVSLGTELPVLEWLSRDSGGTYVTHIN